MMRGSLHSLSRAFLVVLVSGSALRAQDPELARLREQVATLEQRINQLREELLALHHASAVAETSSVLPQESGGGLRLGERVLLGGEAGFWWVDTGDQGRFPNQEFRVDEARLFLDVRLLDNAFLFAELNLAERELENSVEIGELYVDIEDLDELWGGTGPSLTLRAGRFDIPFGEEYRTRDAIDNPFISHTLADIWGVDEGAEVFGAWGPVDYTLAVQNGGYERWRDCNPDKAYIARLGVEPASGWRASASAMRTGDISAEDDEFAEVWFGNSYLAPLGALDSTTVFGGELVQGDLRRTWKTGYAAAALGGIRYTDDDKAADQDRSATYWSVEAVQELVGRWYGGARYSQVQAPDGFVVPGNASAFERRSWILMDDIWRLSFVLGHRWSERLLWKVEYTAERGDRTGGGSAEQQDLLATEIACGF